ncbi:hypothetical protein L226DRAFT_386129 [Lentinus tigrinus ALCF2SS1-7]|uniref:uncharacterized protein n=1 Tax=Lentinus tigrinus ALCF2SS1-7 TaxID=1328758 RepID=UPI0011663412|nr:hypothetical protein L226DRAFT_386129 [Lentinus tigrinus ALCF2SS1-7]
MHLGPWHSAHISDCTSHRDRDSVHGRTAQPPRLRKCTVPSALEYSGDSRVSCRPCQTHSRSCGCPREARSWSAQSTATQRKSSTLQLSSRRTSSTSDLASSGPSIPGLSRASSGNLFPSTRAPTSTVSSFDAVPLGRQRPACIARLCV